MSDVDPAGSSAPGSRSRSGPADARPVVIYVVGSGRSGSTLLERVVGGVDGMTNVGELIDLFRWVAPQDERCGCGQAFSTCEFWTAVGARAYGGWTDGLCARMTDLQDRVARQRRLPQVLLSRRSTALAAGLGEYHDAYRELYDAILDVSGGDVIVDASKRPVQALAIARGGDIDVRLLHLVRDVRGVAFSWAKSDVERPHATGGRTTMAVQATASTAARWSACQVQAEVVGRLTTSYHRVRYEDLVSAPTRTTTAALAGLGLPRDPWSLDHLAGGVATLAASHGLSGNPSRFRTGPQELRLDEEWRRSMTRRDRRTATVVGGALLARYGYRAGGSSPG